MRKNKQVANVFATSFVFDIAMYFSIAICDTILEMQMSDITCKLIKIIFVIRALYDFIGLLANQKLD